jgi:hypothetical protein
MLKFTMNGKPVRPSDIEKEIMRAVAVSVVQEMRERLSAIRHPDTGEFPTIVEGNTLDDMGFRLEGSSALLEIVKARLSPEELETMSLIPMDAGQVPRVIPELWVRGSPACQKDC